MVRPANSGNSKMRKSAGKKNIQPKGASTDEEFAATGSEDSDEGVSDNDEDESDSDDDADSEGESTEGEYGEGSEEEDEEEEDEFEEQSSSDDDSLIDLQEAADDGDREEVRAMDKVAKEHLTRAEGSNRDWLSGLSREAAISSAKSSGMLDRQQLLHVDDLSSDDEDAEGLNTVGRVPLHWYDAFDHIGYDVAGQKVAKAAQGDRLDVALSNRDDPESKRTVYDMYNGRAVTLSDRDMEIIRRLQAGAFAHPEHDDTPEYIDYFSSIKEVMPIRAVPEKKSNFQPSRYESMRIMKIVKDMEAGRYVTLAERAQKRKELMSGGRDGADGAYQLWNEEEDEVLAESRRYKFHLPAPKMPLPGHAESYNPPEEYLLTEEEQEAQAKLDPEDRKFDFMPKKHAALRHVSGYQNFIRERFERCLDLYLCPRQLKRRLNIDPDTLLPHLPKPRELKPFPNMLCLQYLGHKGAVRCMGISPDGQYLVSGGEDGTVRLWEVDTCLCRRVWKLDAPITSLAYNPSTEHNIVAVSSGSRVVLITPGVGNQDAVELTETMLAGTLEGAARAPPSTDHDDDDDDDDDNDGEGAKDSDDGDDEEEGVMKSSERNLGKWHKYRGNGEEEEEGAGGGATWLGAAVGCRLQLLLPTKVTQITWHARGDYLAVVAPDAGAQSVTVHQISRGASQAPFRKALGLVQCVAFHPTRPFFFVTTQQYVRVYHLVEQKLIKRLSSGCKWMSCMTVHSSGDHVVVGSYDRRLVWFDMDMGARPYKTLKFHAKALRAVCFHHRYPLMASCSDDGSVHVFHSMVYDDLARNPMVVPLKVLKAHGSGSGARTPGVLSTMFHPKQPWLFSCGADGVINLYQDI